MIRTTFLYMAALSNFDVYTLKCPNGDVLISAMAGNKVVAEHFTKE
jgi:hypothetical protein